MSNTVLGINQGDLIYYYDLSTGDIARDWWFPGGSPTGGTGYGPSVRYYNVNLDGYDAKLTVTGYGGIQRTEYKSNIIVVYPEIFNTNYTVTRSSNSMSVPAYYQSTGSAGSGYQMYTWNVPGLGATSGATLSSFNYTPNDWYTVAGTYSGSTNSSVLVSSGLSTISVVGNNSTTNINLQYNKIGPQESFNFWNPGVYATSGLYYTPSIFDTNTGYVGLGGSNLVLNISAYSSELNNTKFHSTDEVVYFYPNSPDVSVPIKFRILLDPVILDNIYGNTGVGPLYIPTPEITLGSYIKPSGVSDYMVDGWNITDYLTSGGGNGITNLSELNPSSNRSWSNQAINDFLSNQYYLSASSKYVERFGYGSNKAPSSDLASVTLYGLGANGYSWSGTGGTPPASMHGVSTLSSYGANLFYGGNPTIDLEISLYDEIGDLIDSAICVLSSPGATGNTYDTRMMVAQDTSYGSLRGISHYINKSLNSDFLHSLSDYVKSEAIEYYAPYYNGGNQTSPRYDHSNFHGIRISIIDPYVPGYDKYISAIAISWGPSYYSWIDNYVYGHATTAVYNALRTPFALAGGKNPKSWTGMPSYITLANGTDHNDYFKGWKLGGSI
jgi:hypothetical protein